jgi:NAD(P)-dependent dehydrogenase (short-subunit alcohol dehydrogenase family)
VGVSPGSIGEYMALAIAKHQPALLILASRSQEKINSVISGIKTEIDTKAIEIDLSSQASVRKAAEEINNLTPKLDIVINNAAVNVVDRQFTKEGIELHFGTNHIGLFLLTNLVIDKVKAAANKRVTRVVNVSSEGHRGSPIRFSDYNFDKKVVLEEEQTPPLPPAFLDPNGEPYSSFVAYGRSKTANILFSVSLRGRGITSYAVHPGGKSKSNSQKQRERNGDAD